MGLIWVLLSLAVILSFLRFNGIFAVFFGFYPGLYFGMYLRSGFLCFGFFVKRRSY